MAVPESGRLGRIQEQLFSISRSPLFSQRPPRLCGSFVKNPGPKFSSVYQRMSPVPDSETPSPARQHLWGTLGLLLAVVALGTLMSQRHLLEPRAVAKAPLNTQCDLHRSTCSSELPTGGRVSLSILPHPIPVMRPLALEVRVEGASPSNVTVDFSGVNMDMGLNRADLQPSNDGYYTGKAILPVCVRSLMVWNARVLMEVDGALIEAPFRFGTRRNR